MSRDLPPLPNGDDWNYYSNSAMLDYARTAIAQLRAATEDERKAFESWARSFGYKYDELERCTSGIVGPAYYRNATQEAWVAWQARAALARKEN